MLLLLCMLVRPNRVSSSSSSSALTLTCVDTSTTIMGMLMSVSRVNGVMSDAAYENMATANDALNDASLHDTIEPPPSSVSDDRVPLTEIPSATAPVLAFTLRDGTWRLAKARGAGGSAIKTTGRLALDCCMCWSSDVTQATTHGIHPILSQVLAVRVPCCSACEQRAKNCHTMGTECMSCLTNEAQCVMERGDNHARAQLCQRCVDAKWCQAMAAAVGFTVRAIPVDLLMRSSSPKTLAATASPKKKKAAARKRKADDPKTAPTSSMDGGCEQCSETVVAVTCGTDECSTSFCAQCLRQRHGIMAAVYERQRGLWVCPAHAD